MQTDLFSSRHIGITDQELPQMLATIGVKSIEELIDQTIPTNIRLKKPLQLPAAMTEAEFLNHIRQIAAIFCVTYLKIQCGTLRTRLIKPKFLKAD